MVTALLRFCGLARRADLIRAEQCADELAVAIRAWQEFGEAATKELARLHFAPPGETDSRAEDQHTCH